MFYKTDIWDSVFKNFKDPICIVDRYFNILRINKKLLSLISSTEHEALGNPCQQLLYKGLTHKHIKQIEKVLTTKVREVIYLYFLDKFYELTIEPVIDDKQQVFALVYIYNDISDRVKFEEIINKKINKEYHEI